MNREYHRWFSPRLGRDMELVVFGHAGRPLIVFPTSMGRFFEYEDRGMVAATRGRYENGELQTYCVDAIENESWYNRGIPPRARVARHLQFEQYILYEVIPLIRRKNPSPELALTGCSFGGYHVINFALRHPDLATYAVSMSGAYDIHQFLDGYYDEDCYFNCPPDFLPNLSDPWHLDQYRSRVKFILGAGEHDICLGENLRLAHIMGTKQIPHWLDIWGGGAVHDWPLWQRMAAKYF